MALVKTLAEIGFEEAKAKHLGFDMAAGLTATGSSSQSDAYAITANHSQFTSVTGAANSARLPSAIASHLGEYHVRNDDSADALKLYPATGETINGLSANAAIDIPAGTGMSCFRASDGKWLCIGAPTNITQIANRSHTSLTDIGTNTHAQIDTHINNTAIPVASLLTWWETGWISETRRQNVTWTYASANSVSGPSLVKFPIGTRVKIIDTGGVHYGYVITGTASTLTFLLDTALNGSAINAFYAMTDNPDGHPDWIAYTPNITANAGTFTSVVISFCYFRLRGKRVDASLYIRGVQTVANADYLQWSSPFSGLSSGNFQYCPIYTEESTVGAGFALITSGSATHRFYKAGMAQWVGGANAYCIGNFSFAID